MDRPALRNPLSRVRIIVKVLIAPVATALMMASLWSIAWLGLQNQARVVDDMVEAELRATNEAASLIQSISRVQSDLFRLMVWQEIERDNALLEELNANIDARIAAIRPAMGQLFETVARLEADVKVPNVAVQDYISQARNSRRAAYGHPGFASSMMVTTAQLYDGLIGKLDAMQAQIESHARRRAEAVAAEADTLSRVLAAVVLGDLVLAVTITWLVSRHISRGIRNTTRDMTALAQGHTALDLADWHRRDEIGEMVAALAVLRDSELEKRQLDAERQRSHRRVQESLDYAERMQRTALPRPDAPSLGLADLSVWWEPRDEVGGDVYYWAQRDNATAILVMDCTGHGVPGALIGFTALATADRILTQAPSWRPRTLLRALDRNLRSQLHRTAPDTVSPLQDDGLEAGLAVIDHTQDELRFAGVGTDLFAVRDTGVTTYRGAWGGIAYRDLAMPRDMQRIDIAEASTANFVLATDGILEQPGSGRAIMLGRRRFAQMLARHMTPPTDLATGVAGIQDEFGTWHELTPRVDDCTLIAFRPQRPA